MGTGGSRNGAGRPATHLKAEYLQRVDVRRWKQDGLMPAQSSKAILTFSIDGREVTQHIWLTHTPCNYGGTRAWFSCPRCQKRAAVLHLRGGAGFICSKCGRVKHASQSENSMQLAWRAQRKIEERLVHCVIEKAPHLCSDTGHGKNEFD